jgi:formylglycine-generating enzyme required for sulfatase activity
VSASLLEVVATRAALTEDGYQVMGRGDDLQVQYQLGPLRVGLWEAGGNFQWGLAQLLLGVAAGAEPGSGVTEWSVAREEAAGFLAKAEQALLEGRGKDALLAAGACEACGEAAGPLLRARARMVKGLVRFGYIGGDLGLCDLASAEQAFAEVPALTAKRWPVVAAHAWLAAAQAAFLQERYGEARARLAGVLALVPGFGEAYYHDAQIARATGDEKRLEGQLAQAIARDRAYALRAIASQEADPAKLPRFLTDLAGNVWAEGCGIMRETLGRLTFWRSHYPAARDHLEVRRLVAFLAQGQSWTLFEVLQTLTGREAAAERVLEGADEARIPNCEEIAIGLGGEDKLSGERVEIRNGRDVELGGFELCALLPGELAVGSSRLEPNRGADENRFDAVLARGFWMARTPVTRKLWELVIGSLPGPGPGEDHPVSQVSWLAAVRFCNFLSTLCGLPLAYTYLEDGKVAWGHLAGEGFRLPTEVEWEYACRSGTLSAYAFGAHLTAAQANYGGLTGKTTTPVATYPPNHWGLYDMHGQLWEWCWDGYAPYPISKTRDPISPGDDGLRVLRGGAWSSDPDRCRSAAREKAPEWQAQGTFGFRIARSIPT